MSLLLDSLATTDALAASFSDEALLSSMCRFEVALARAEAEAGVIPAAAADAIARAADADALDARVIARGARTSGTITIPFVEMFTAQVRVQAPDAATFVHWGATSQDVSDTALVLCLVTASRLIRADHDRLARALRHLSDEHAATVMLARTLLQPAAPTTFGLKAAGWLGAVTRAGALVQAGFTGACLLQFGGASGTLAALGPRGPAVSAALARDLGLQEPDAPWHAHRDRLATLVAACGIYTGVLGKIARDVSLLMQHEVAEASEPGGGSSAMPQKRNPSGCAIALAAATRVPGLVSTFLSGMPQEHERGLGGWHAEATTVASAVQATGSALAAIAGVVEQLAVDPDRMRANMHSTRGLVFAERAMVLLAPVMGRAAAGVAIAAAIETTRRDGTRFAEALGARPGVRAALPPDVLAGLDDPAAYLGSAERFRRRLTGAEPD